MAESEYTKEDVKTVWLNKTKNGDGAIVNVAGMLFYAEITDLEDFVNDQLGHGVPLDLINEDEIFEDTED